MKRTLRSLLLVCTLPMVFITAFSATSCAAIRMEADTALFWPVELNPALIPTWPVFPSDTVCEKCEPDSLIYRVEQTQEHSMIAVCEREKTALRDELTNWQYCCCFALFVCLLQPIAFWLWRWLNRQLDLDNTEPNE